MTSGERLPADQIPEDLPSWRREQPLGPWWVLSAGVLLGLILILRGRLLLAMLTVSATLAIVAALRAALGSSHRAGGLQVRSVVTDVLVLLALSGALALLALTSTLD